MATRKLNEFLDADKSDEDEHDGYDSELEDKLRKGGSSAKRRKLENDHSEDEESEVYESDQEEEENNDGAAEDEEAIVKKIEREKKEDVENDTFEDLGAASSKPKPIRKSSELTNISNPLTKKNLVATATAIKKSGVVYLSRLPPFIKPSKLRFLLTPYGPINRIYLTPEDSASHSRRVRNGGNKKRTFTEGWLEFISKADAKRVCELLNAKTIGGKKGTFYHDDIWNLLYLKGFKWSHLTEQMVAENAERASRMRAEIGRTTKENREFVRNVERAKMLEGMEVKKAAKMKRRRDGDGQEERDVDAEVHVKEKGERPRHFKQVAVASKQRSGEQSEDVKRVLSKIF